MRYITTKHGFAVRAYMNNDADIEYLTIGPTFQGQSMRNMNGVFGTAIVCRIGMMWARDGEGKPIRGEYAAYMGVGYPNASEEETVETIARHGVKIDKTLGEFLFEDALKQVFSNMEWRWRD